MTPTYGSTKDPPPSFIAHERSTAVSLQKDTSNREY